MSRGRGRRLPAERMPCPSCGRVTAVSRISYDILGGSHRYFRDHNNPGTGKPCLARPLRRTEGVSDEPEWPSGVSGKRCDECLRTTVVRSVGVDEQGKPDRWICRPCASDDGTWCTCGHDVVDYSDPDRYHPENVDRDDDPGCPLHGSSLDPQ